MDCQSTVEKSVQNPFATLSGDCLSEILSRTSPSDASRFAVISKASRNDSDSDIVWDNFVPMDIVSKAVSALTYSTKKELYLNLCNNPILIDAGKLSFSLEKKTGKKCFMVGAKELMNSWEDGTNNWKWKSNRDSRFGEVLELKIISCINIRGAINTRMLSQKTKYKAYLVFKLANIISGVLSLFSDVRLLNHESDSEDEYEEIKHMYRGGAPIGIRCGHRPVQRDDGWTEIVIGEFSNDRGDDGEIEAWLMEIWKLEIVDNDLLIIEGIEFRPHTWDENLNNM